MSRSEQPEKPLNDRQHAVIDALLGGRTITAAAKECGVARRTAQGWLAEPAFQEALQTRRQEIADRIEEDVVEIQTLALGILKRHLRGDVGCASSCQIETALKITSRMGTLSLPRTARAEQSRSTPKGQTPDV